MFPKLQKGMFFGFFCVCWRWKSVRYSTKALFGMFGVWIGQPHGLPPIMQVFRFCKLNLQLPNQSTRKGATPETVEYKEAIAVLGTAVLTATFNPLIVFGTPIVYAILSLTMSATPVQTTCLWFNMTDGRSILPALGRSSAFHLVPAQVRLLASSVAHAGRVFCNGYNCICVQNTRKFSFHNQQSH